MTGDRFCTHCGYNLVGQEIVREEHYALLIVRCPECATVTGLQDYPRLGTWGARWGTLLAALWMILLLCLWPASSAVVLAFGVGMADMGSRNYGWHLNDLQNADEAQTNAAAGQPPAAPPAPTAPPATQTPLALALQGQLVPGTVITQQGTTIIVRGTGRGGSSTRFGTWWAQQDQQAILADAGGWWGVLDAVDVVVLVPAAVAVYFIGCLWSVLLLQVPRRRLVYCGLAIVGLACVIAIIPLMEWDARSVASARRAAMHAVGLPTVAATFGVLSVPLLLGLWLGRPSSRLAVRALLPPRLRGPIALLWTAEGIPPPAARVP
jgi:hypothetical protein